MSTLKHGEFDLNGYRFGDGHPVYPSGTSRGGIEWRDQDTANPVGDGILFGRDHRTPKPRRFALTITGDTPAEAAAHAAELARAWEYTRDRWEPGEEVVLAWGQHGRTLRQYGRPRGLDLDDADLWVLETLTNVPAEFVPSDPVAYEDTARRIKLTLTPGRAGGMVFPIEFPWGTTEGGRRQGIITDGGGHIPTNDVTITIHGPVSRPTVSGPGWTIPLNTTLAWDRSIAISARHRTVLRDDGASMAGVLGRGTRLSDVTIPPGHSEITFTGEDTSGTSHVTVTWHPVVI